MVFLPNEIMIIITNYLGNDYWHSRYLLTHISNAMDLLSSDYSFNSYWKWHKWRFKHNYIKLQKPILPNRLYNIHYKNKFIYSIDPPKSKLNYNSLRDLHTQYRKKVYF